MKVLVPVGISLLENQNDVRVPSPNLAPEKGLPKEERETINKLAERIRGQGKEACAEIEGLNAIKNYSSVELLPFYTRGSLVCAYAIEKYLKEKGIPCQLIEPSEHELQFDDVDDMRLRRNWGMLVETLSNNYYDAVLLSGGYKGGLLLLFELAGVMKALGHWPHVKVYYKYKDGPLVMLPLFAGHLNPKELARKVLASVRDSGSEIEWMWEGLLPAVFPKYIMVYVTPEVKEKLDGDQDLRKRVYNLIKNKLRNPYSFDRHTSSKHRIYGRGKEPRLLVHVKGHKNPENHIAQAKTKFYIYGVYPRHTDEYERALRDRVPSLEELEERCETYVLTQED